MQFGMNIPQKYRANFIFQNGCLAGACGHADVIMECLAGLMFITETIPLSDINCCYCAVLDQIRRLCVVYFFSSNLELSGSHF